MAGAGPGAVGGDVVVGGVVVNDLLWMSVHISDEVIKSLWR